MSDNVITISCISFETMVKSDSRRIKDKSEIKS